MKETEKLISTYSRTRGELDDVKTPVEVYWNDYTVRSEAFGSARESLAWLDWIYNSGEYTFARELLGLWEDRRNEVMLDYGCGPGNGMVGLLVHGRAKRVIGADVSSKSLDLAKRRLELHDIEPERYELIQVSDADLEMPLENHSIDHVHCNGVIHHVTFPAKVLREFSRVLKPMGTATIMVYHQNSVWWHLWVAYKRMIMDNAFPGASIDEAFSKCTDGQDCPLARAYLPEDFVGICSEAGFEAEFKGAFLARRCLIALAYRDVALTDGRLAEEHKDFIRELTFDDKGYPVYRGVHAGLFGVYNLTKP